MCAEGVCINASPTRIGASWAFVARADAVAPVILVTETPARPAYNGHVQLFQRSDDIIAQTARVRDWRVFTYPEAAVYQAAQVFSELSIDVAIDRAVRLVGSYHQLSLERFCVLRQSAKRQGRQDQRGCHH